MAFFKIAHKRTSVFEGGFQNDPDDNGNWTGGGKGSGVLIGTNRGITAPVLMAFLGRTPTVTEMKNISEDTVESIYRKNYWNPIRGDEMNNQDEANAMYDSAVNMGVGTAIILAKRAMGLPENSKMDDELLNKLNNKA